jgi:hypothetical protein
MGSGVPRNPHLTDEMPVCLEKTDILAVYHE